MKRSVLPAAAIDADVGADANGCAGADGGEALAARTEHLTVVVRASNLHFQGASIGMGIVHLMTSLSMSVSMSLHWVAVCRGALKWVGRLIHSDPKTYCLTHDATNLFDQL